MKKVYKFYADWCGPCKTLSKTLETITTDVIIEEVNIDENQSLPAKFNIRGVPTMVMLNEEGNLVKTLVGVKPKVELEKWLSD
jgi:thioredoxin 1